MGKVNIKLTDFNRSQYSDVYIYSLYADDDCVYVGQTSDLYRRIKEHERNPDLYFDSFSIQSCKEYESNDLEAMEIVRQQPKHNKSLPKNNVFMTQGAASGIISDILASKVKELPVVFCGERSKIPDVSYIKIKDFEQLRFEIESIFNNKHTNQL